MGNGFADIAKLGSPSALSLLASAGTTPIPALVIGGALLAVAGSVFVYTKFEKYEAKKHKKKIEEIIHIYEDKLKKIVVPYYGSIDGFPTIFQLTKEGTYESLHYTLAEVRDIGLLLPSGDVALVSYRESIRAALRKLKEYYFLRAKGDDSENDEITLRVLSYLLHMIDTKCLNFLGYEYDIAYLGALTEFINTYASLGRGEHTQHFDRLKEVYSNLLEAKQKLEKHKEVLSLEETVSALRDHCIQHSDLLIRTLVKMVVGKDDTDLTKTVNHDELIDGVLRKHYIHSEVWGVVLRADSEIDIPESVFKEWIKNLSKYYLSSLNTETSKKTEKIPTYEDFFSFIKEAKNYLANKEIPPVDKAAKKISEEMRKQLSLIAKVFINSDNFISTVYRATDKTFHVVKDGEQLVERTLDVANFAKLTDDVISLQYLLIQLCKSIKKLGEIYTENPAHFHRILTAVDKLCVLVQEDLKTSSDDFTSLQEKNKDQMQVAKKELFPNEVKGLLEALSVGIELRREDIKRCRAKAQKAISTDTVQSASYEMFEVANSILGRYGISIAVNASESAEAKPVLDKAKPSEPALKPELTPVIIKPAIVKPEPGSAGVQPDSTRQPAVEIEPLEKLKNITQGIYSAIEGISKTDKHSATNYFKIYDALIVMQEKAITLDSEENKSEERLFKAEKTLEITTTLAQKVADFLNKKPEERKQEAASFAKEIHKILNNEDNSDVIDAHHNELSRYIYTHLCNFGLFKTDTRKKFIDLDVACSKLSLG